MNKNGIGRVVILTQCCYISKKVLKKTDKKDRIAE